MSNGDDQPRTDEEALHEAESPPPDDDVHGDAPADDMHAESPHAESPHAESRRRRLEHLIPDIVRRTFYAGLGAVFTTEEGIRKLASDLKLPKDVANYLIQQAASSKDELLRVVGKELRGFLESVNISGEMQKLLTSLSFEIKTEIRFIPNDSAIGGVKSDIKVGRMSFRRHKDKDKDDKKKHDKEHHGDHDRDKDES